MVDRTLLKKEEGYSRRLRKRGQGKNWPNSVATTLGCKLLTVIFLPISKWKNTIFSIHLITFVEQQMLIIQ